MSSQHSTESDCDPLRRDHGCSRIYGNVDVIATLVSRSVIHIDCKSFNICACGFVSRPYMFIFDEILSHWGGYGLSGTWFQRDLAALQNWTHLSGSALALAFHSLALS